MAGKEQSSQQATAPGDSGGESNVHQKIYLQRPVWVVIAAIVAMTLLLSTAAVAVCTWQSHDPKPLFVLGAIWAVGPPSWFWFEYFYLYRSSKGNPSGFEQFKHGQQVAIAIWAGVALAVFAYASSDHFKPEKGTTSAINPCTQCLGQDTGGKK